MKQSDISSTLISDHITHPDVLNRDGLNRNVANRDIVNRDSVNGHARSDQASGQSATMPSLHSGNLPSEHVHTSAGRSHRSLIAPDEQSILVISPMADAMTFAATLGLALGCVVHVAGSHRAGVIALRHRDYAVVVVDDCLAEANVEAVDLLWQSFGAAIPVRVNFAFSGESRLAREVQAAIVRRDQQRVLASRAAVTQLANELKSTVTGLLLQSQLALAEPALTPRLSGKLTLMAELAGSLRQRLEGSAPGRVSAALQ